MTCPHCRGVEKIFDQRTAERDLKAYRAHGPGTTTRLLIAALKAAGVADRTLLDIGGGVGAIQHELLKDRARSAIAIDASSAYLHAAKQEADRQGYTDRIVYHQGDFVELAPQLPQADIVTLEKVILLLSRYARAGRPVIGACGQTVRRRFPARYMVDATRWPVCEPLSTASAQRLPILRASDGSN